MEKLSINQPIEPIENLQNFKQVKNRKIVNYTTNDVEIKSWWTSFTRTKPQRSQQNLINNKHTTTTT